MAEVHFRQATRIYPGNDEPAVDALDLDIADGEFMVLVGPSGSGKTTALRMLAGLEEVDAGGIYIGERDVTYVPPKDRDVAMVFQNYALYPYLTVAANIGFPLRIAKVKKAERERRVREVAELLDTSVASVNSALQRARATLSSRDLDRADVIDVDPEQQELLAQYVDAFERYDINSLVTLLRDDAVMSMPPFDFWLEGPTEMGRWFLGEGAGCRGSRLIATTANGCAAFASYKPDGKGGRAPFAIQVIEVSGDRIIGHHNFLDTDLFEAFGFPADPDGLDG
jgi:ABC-type lipopolysaccharide export system ATPase subunit